MGDFLWYSFSIILLLFFFAMIGCFLWAGIEFVYGFIQDKAKEFGLIEKNEDLFQKLVGFVKTKILGAPIKQPQEQEEQILSPRKLSYQEEYWGLISYAYGKIKTTTIFRLWKKEQYDCQFGKCAICGKPLLDIKYSQVDHVKPRYKGGTNYAHNLTLVHSSCNRNKSAKTGYRRPDWIKFNKHARALNNKVYEITEEVRKDYPTEFPDEWFKKPNL